MGVELFSDISLSPDPIETPLSNFIGRKISHPAPCLVSILRAGSIMTEALLELCPQATVEHIGLYRDHDTLEPKEYLNALTSNLSKKIVILCDPMLATGGSAIHAVNLLKNSGASDIRFICLLAAQYGITKLQASHPDVSILAAAKDANLNDKGYIVPGLGDAGDRIFGTLKD